MKTTEAFDKLLKLFENEDDDVFYDLGSELFLNLDYNVQAELLENATVDILFSTITKPYGDETLNAIARLIIHTCREHADELHPKVQKIIAVERLKGNIAELDADYEPPLRRLIAEMNKK